MQDPQIGRWNGIDQLADKYLSSSPYGYALNNPVRNIDIAGKWVETVIGNQTYRLQQTGEGSWAFYANHGNGQKYAGTNPFVNTMTNSINQVANTNDKMVQGRFNEVVTSATILTLKDAEGVPAFYNPHTNTAFLNDEDEVLQTGEYTTPASDFVHEILGHGWQDLHHYGPAMIDLGWHPDQVRVDGIWYPLRESVRVTITGMTADEKDASSIENNFRSKNNLPLRMHYTGKNLDPLTGRVVPEINGKNVRYGYPTTPSKYFKQQPNGDISPTAIPE